MHEANDAIFPKELGRQDLTQVIFVMRFCLCRIIYIYNIFIYYNIYIYQIIDLLVTLSTLVFDISIGHIKLIIKRR